MLYFVLRDCKKKIASNKKENLNPESTDMISPKYTKIIIKGKRTIPMGIRHL